MVSRSCYTALLLAALVVAVLQPALPAAAIVVVLVGLVLRVAAMPGRARRRRAALVLRTT